MEYINFFATILTILQSDPYKVILLILVFALIVLIPTYKLIINSIRYGLLDFFSQKDNPKKSDKVLSEKIRKADEIKILFTTGAGFFSSFKTSLIPAIKNNATIKILIGAKDQLFLNDVNRIEGRPINSNINLEVDQVIRVVEEIRKAAGVDNTRIELKHFSTEFRTSMILIDSGKGKWGKLTLTLPPAKAADSMSFYIRGKLFYNKNKDNIYEQCENHFDEIWKIY